MLKAYIVDDEPLARDELKYLLNRSKQVEILGESDCIEDAINDITHLVPDLVFIDIDLDEESGISLANQIEDLETSPAIVFATAYDEYALQAFEVNALDYILKPFDEERIQKTIEKINRMKIGNRGKSIHPPLKKEQIRRMPVLVEDRIVLISLDTILFLESSEGKCTIRTVNQEYKVSDPLVVLEKKLDNMNFLRVHRSYVVNVNHIIEIEPWFNSTHNLIMDDGSKVPVSRTYVKELKQLFGF